MSLLKALEAEAERKRQERAEAEQRGSDIEAQFHQQVRPALTRLHDAFQRFANSLMELRPATELHFEVPGYGSFSAVVEHDYGIAMDPRASVAELTLSFHATIDPQAPEVELSGAPLIRSVQELFQEAGISAFKNGKRDVKGHFVQATFKPRGKVPLQVRVSGDTTSSEIRVLLRNFEALGQISKSYPMEDFDEALFDRLLRYIARTDNELTREQLPDKVRTTLRTKVQQEQLRRKWEDQIYQQRLREEEAARLAREQARLHNVLRRWLADQWGRLAGWQPVWKFRAAVARMRKQKRSRDD